MRLDHKFLQTFVVRVWALREVLVMTRTRVARDTVQEKTGRQFQFQKTNLSFFNTSKGSQTRFVVGKVAWGKDQCRNS